MSPGITVQRVSLLPNELSNLLSRYAKRFLKPEHPSDIFAASSADNLVGAIITTLEPLTRKGEVEALVALPQGRTEDVIDALMDTAERHLRDSGAIVVTMNFDAEDVIASQLQRVLHHRGWYSPQLFLKRYEYLCRDFHPSWFEREYPLPADFEEFSWKALTKPERLRIEHELASGTFPLGVYPFGDDESLIEPLNSLGLRHQGVVIGWMICHRLDEKTIRYSYLYVRDDHRHQPYTLRLLVDAIRLQQKSSVPLSIFEVNVTQVHRRWLEFVRTRLAPYANKTMKTLMSWKDLR